jgi:hypothetical protein
VTVKLKISGNALSCTAAPNVGFGSTKESELIGKAE